MVVHEKYQDINNESENSGSMKEKFKPLDYSPRLVYGADYWSIVAQDTFEFFRNSIMWGFTRKFPFIPGHVIKYCGNPECYSLIAYYPDDKPANCKSCGKEIDWE
jgi:hypothetical protein